MRSNTNRRAHGEGADAEASDAEASFDQERRAVLDLLGFSAEEPSVTGGNGDDYFLRLLAMGAARRMRDTSRSG
ncbi:hypothetical protein NYR55_03415 [Sphingomonas sp. BGYR3]|uniref:hypothetical protein n=1 Tax=Sphingomonas sp. BGYR3 TaxID=2975483 RepID=UPI0021A477FA|nr:hypothetical protein [Sphingomonas sp. BGYR3]MDG5487674.1 hypothetical protein [Sphingomonas sp. BGYR3]